MKILPSIAAALAPALALTLSPSVVNAQDIPNVASAEATPLEKRAADIVRLIKGEAEPEEIFGDRFLKAVPASQMRQIGASLTSQFGAIEGVESVTPRGTYGADIALRFERAIGRGRMVLSPLGDNRIEGFVLNQFDPIGDSANKIKADLEALPGEVGAYFGPLDGSAPRLALNPDKQLAIGSTFKIYVLSALARKIEAGEARWSDVITISPRSFPSGMMQDWPEPSPVTLHTLATMMIAISDNTATDTLMEYLGQDAVIAEMRSSGHSQPELNIPFIGTRHLFKLKSAGPETIAKYREADVAGKYAILDSVEEMELDQNKIEATFSGKPVALDIEWLGSAQDMRRMLAQLLEVGSEDQLKIMEVNPSAQPTALTRYKRILYKGGSEPGVLNYTWLLQDKSDDWHVLTLSWNNPEAALDDAAFQLIGQRLLNLPHEAAPSKAIEPAP
jgi:hypothetical protein